MFNIRYDKFIGEYIMKEFFLTTERLGFSVWNENDIFYALELWGNPEVTKFIVAGGTMLKEDVQQRLKKEIETFNNVNIQYWPIYFKETHENVGCCGVRPYDCEKNILEMGVHIKEQHWGIGIAQEACSKVIEYCFNTLKVKALFAGHNPKNISSAGLLKKLGFTYTHDEFYPPTGLYHPSYLLTKQDYTDKKAERI